MTVLRALSLNLWKNEGRFVDRMKRITAGLLAADADVVALQECFTAPSLKVDAADELAERCGLSLTRAAQRDKLRHHGAAQVDSRSDLAVLTRNPVTKTETFSLPNDPRDGPRSLLIVTLDWDGRPLRIGCTHFTHLADGQELRRQQADETLALMLNRPAETAILMGDLNANAAAPELAVLMNHRRLHPDSAAQATAASGAGQTGGAIDHVLLYPAAGEAWTSYRRVILPPSRDDPASGPSDHPAILCELDRTS